MYPESSDLNSLSATNLEFSRRTEERFHVPVDVEMIAGGQEIPELAVLRDVSTQGVGIEHAIPVNVGQVVTCKLLDIPFDGPNSYRIEILWTDGRREDGTILSGGRILDESTESTS